MAQVRVRPVEHAEVGQVLDHRAVQGARAAGPDVGQRAPAAAGDADRVHELDGAEAGREDDEVEGCGIPAAAVAVFDFDAGRGDAGDRAGFEDAVGLPQRGVVVVGADDTLAAGAVVGREALPQLGLVWQLLLHGVGAPGADLLGEGGVRVGHGAVEALAEVHLRGADAPAQRGDVAEQRAAEGGHGGVVARYHPVGGPLVDGYLGGGLDELGDDLRGRGAWSGKLADALRFG